MNTKICIKCGIEKTLDAFSKDRRRKDGKQAYCKDCYKQFWQGLNASGYNREYRKRNIGRRREKANARKAAKKALIMEYKSQPCVDCGFTFFPCQMDFDHRDPSQKINNISAMVDDNYSMKTLLAELAKCDLVCANCHRLREHGRLSNHKCFKIS